MKYYIVQRCFNTLSPNIEIRGRKHAHWCHGSILLLLLGFLHQICSRFDRVHVIGGIRVDGRVIAVRRESISVGTHNCAVDSAHVGASDRSRIHACRGITVVRQIQRHLLLLCYCAICHSIHGTISIQMILMIVQKRGSMINRTC